MTNNKQSKSTATLKIKYKNALLIYDDTNEPCVGLK